MHKAAANIFQGRRFLVERSRGKSVWGHPGGKLEPGETSRQALVRELAEEFMIDVDEVTWSSLARFTERQPAIKVSGCKWMCLQ